MVQSKRVNQVPVKQDATEWEEQGSIFHRWEKEGDALEGVFAGRETFTYDNGGDGARLIIQCSDGERRSILETFQLAQELGGFPVGTPVRIVYIGKASIKGGKNIQKFHIYVRKGSVKVLPVAVEQPALSNPDDSLPF